MNGSVLLTWRDILITDTSYIPDHWLDYPPPSNLENYILGILYAVLYIMGIGTNGTFMALYIRRKYLRSPSNNLLFQLALGDFLMVGKIPYFVYNSIVTNGPAGPTGCAFYGFVGGLTGTSSIMTLACIACERFRTIRWPLKRRMSTRESFFVIIFIWSYSLAFSVMPLIGVYSRYCPEGYLTSCSFDYLDDRYSTKVFIWVFFLAAYCVPLTSIVASYAAIVMTVKSSDITTFRDSQIQSRRSVHRAEIKIARMSFTLVLIWLTAWTPYAIVALIGVTGRGDLLTPRMSMLPALFAKTASIIDPIIYCLLHPKFKAEIKKLLYTPSTTRNDMTLQATRGASR